MRFSTGRRSFAPFSAACSLAIFAALWLLPGCQRETGFCETSSDCTDGRVCSATEHLCLGVGQGGGFLLTVKTLGDGTVSVEGQQSPCSGSCQLMVPAGTAIRLKARPAGGARFTGWSEGCSGDEVGCVLAPSGETTVTASFAAKICGGSTAIDNWCWETPLPQGNSLESVWRFSDSDVWAVGGVGTILHWDGTAWSKSASGTTQNLHGVFGKSPNDLWAVGDAGTILRYGGTAWTPVASGSTARLNAVWGSASNDIWVVGAPAGGVTALLHFTGSAFAAVANSLTFEMFSIWGSGAADIWTVGDKGISGHYTGGTFAPVAVNGTGLPVYSVSGSSATDVWAVGAGGSVYRSTGGAWAPVAQGVTAVALRGVSVSGPSELWAVGDSGVILRYQTGAFSLSRNTPDNTLLGVFAPPGQSGAAWAVGQGGTILRKNPGAAWSTVFNSPFVTPYNLFQGIWGSANDDVWVVGYFGVIYHFDGAKFSLVRSNVGDNLFELWGSGPKDVWAVGSNGAIVHYDGQSWMPVASGTTQSLYAIWGNSPTDIWAAGTGGTVTHYNGTVWIPQMIAGGDTIYGIWGRNANDIWAVGRGGYVYRYNGQNWMLSPTYNIDLLGVFGFAGASASDVYAVGRSGLILHYEGSAFQIKASGAPTYDLYRLWGSGPSNLFIAGFTQPTGGIVLKGNGAAFSTSLTLTSSLTAIYGIGQNDIWATGFFGAVVHNPTALQAF